MDELRRLAEKLRCEWSEESHPIPRAKRARWLHTYAVHAGRLLIEAAKAGQLPDDLAQLIRSNESQRPLDQWANTVFIAAAQHWLPNRMPGYGGQTMDYPDLGLDQCRTPGVGSLGLQYAAVMRAIAAALSPSSQVGAEQNRTPGEHPHKPTDIAAKLQCDAKTINSYAKAAGVKTPDRGKCNHIYSHDETIAILRRASHCAGGMDTRNAARAMLREIEKKPTNRN